MTKTKKGQQVTGVWQNGGRSAKLSIYTSINISANLNISTSNPPLRQAPNRYLQPYGNIPLFVGRQNDHPNSYVHFSLWQGSKANRQELTQPIILLQSVKSTIKPIKSTPVCGTSPVALHQK